MGFGFKTTAALLLLVMLVSATSIPIGIGNADGTEGRTEVKAGEFHSTQYLSETQRAEIIRIYLEVALDPGYLPCRGPLPGRRSADVHNRSDRTGREPLCRDRGRGLWRSLFAIWAGEARMLVEEGRIAIFSPDGGDYARVVEERYQKGWPALAIKKVYPNGRMEPFLDFGELYALRRTFGPWDCVYSLQFDVQRNIILATLPRSAGPPCPEGPWDPSRPMLLLTFAAFFVWPWRPSWSRPGQIVGTAQQGCQTAPKRWSLNGVTRISYQRNVSWIVIPSRRMSMDRATLLCCLSRYHPWPRNAPCPRLPRPCCVSGEDLYWLAVE